MASPAGTTRGPGDGWILVEAEVHREQDNSPDEAEDSDAEAGGCDLVDFIDDTEQAEDAGEAQALYQAQCTQENDAGLQALKRKYLKSPQASPVGHVLEQAAVNELSPRLHAITLGQQSQKAKRRLFEQQHQDSGYGDSLQEVEAQAAEETLEQVEGDAQGGTPGGTDTAGTEAAGSHDGVGGAARQASGGGCAQRQDGVVALLHSSNQRATLLGKFKECYGVGFMELVRPFKSDKTCCGDWVVAAFGVPPAVAEGVKTTIQPLCTYAHVTVLLHRWGCAVQLLLSFKAAKNRGTVRKAMETLLTVPGTQMLIEPPRLRSTPAALYWYRASLSSGTDVYGEAPDWLKRQTMVSHSLEEASFSLSEMVQWAYDNGHTEDSTIAYEYACIADVCGNAAAFLNSNCQAKYVKDCGTMVRHYRRAEMSRMTMAEWIDHRCAKVGAEGDWRPIVRFLRYQGIEFISFCGAFKAFLKGIPKKNCIVICGPPNTGKSYFGMSLMSFLDGKVLSYCNSSSHFWLQPLADAKVAMLDDATPQCWDYIDTYMRNAMDGNPVCVDVKHKAPLQLKCPPLLITTNTNIREDDRWPYLKSRHCMFTFPNEMPFTPQGAPVYQLCDANWKAFFGKSWAQLDLGDRQDIQDNGRANQPFRCVAGEADRLL
ncbi:early protein E1 [Alouatta guariba papillomavirus 1]|uniref:Replication protein E1 n=1 Tax=Alouatta guariba papillomavirus 1 TaxID=1784959 RepID=A0A140CC05_9PAPI|nr:early protein E1 [Alouatta guariba papillomavirus 1]AMB19787.1 early protein E1 [Alouatta guariba papillomavirus 1]